jgi:hypothetical protein
MSYMSSIFFRALSSLKQWKTSANPLSTWSSIAIKDLALHLVSR